MLDRSVAGVLIRRARPLTTHAVGRIPLPGARSITFGRVTHAATGMQPS